MNITLNTWELLGASLVLLAAMASFLKYVFYLLEKHEKFMDNEIKSLKKTQEQHKKDIKTNNELVRSVREELYSDYVKSDRLDAEFREMKSNFEKVFGYLTSLARDVNKLIGKDEAHSESLIKKGAKHE